MKSKIVLPYAPILVESTRSIGYSFETALADIIDNSIGKEADEVRVNFSSKDPQFVAILDNGTGMSEGELESAMRYGSKSSLDARDKDDLGRFGEERIVTYSYEILSLGIVSLGLYVLGDL